MHNIIVIIIIIIITCVDGIRKSHLGEAHVKSEMFNNNPSAETLAVVDDEVEELSVCRCVHRSWPRVDVVTKTTFVAVTRANKLPGKCFRVGG